MPNFSIFDILDLDYGNQISFLSFSLASSMISFFIKPQKRQNRRNNSSKQREQNIQGKKQSNGKYYKMLDHILNYQTSPFFRFLS